MLLVLLFIPVEVIVMHGVNKSMHKIEIAKADFIPQVPSGVYEWTVTHYKKTGPQGQCVIMYGDVYLPGVNVSRSIYCKMYWRKNLSFQSNLLRANLMVTSSNVIDLDAFTDKKFIVKVNSHKILNMPNSIKDLMWVSVVKEIVKLR